MSEHHHTSAATTGPLLPCPFCGGKAIWQEGEGGQAVNFMHIWRINCSECYRIDMPWWSDKIDCIKQWNARSGAPAQAPRDPFDVLGDPAAHVDAPRPDCSAGSVRDVLLNAIDSPTVEALADVFNPRNTQSVLSKSYCEQIVAILEPRIRALPQEVPDLSKVLESCEGEHLKFEAWAADQKYDMHEHPLHYLFMDAKTNAARQGWKAALRYVAEAMALSRPVSGGGQ